MKKAMHALFVLALFAVLAAFSAFRLNEYFTLETVQIQLDAAFQIIYIDPTFMISIGGLIVFPFGFLLVIWTHLLRKDGSGYMGKAFFLLLAVGMIVIIPGQFIEHQRQKSLAREHGYVDCPPFTLLSSTHIVEAMVKDPRYCTDDEITSIARYGYFRELPVVNAYVDSAYGSSEVKL